MENLKPLDLSDVLSKWEGGERGVMFDGPLEPMPIEYRHEMTEDGLRFDLGRGERYVKPPLLPPAGMDLGEYLFEVHLQGVLGNPTMKRFDSMEVIETASLTDHEVTWMEVVPPTIPSLQLIPADMLPTGILAYLPAIKG